MGRALLCLGLLVALGCKKPTPAALHGRHLDPTIKTWLPENRARIDEMMDRLGKSSPSYDAAHPPVATFDWDDTMMKNDIGSATFYAMLQHDEILQPPNRDWSQTSKHLTAAARAELGAACNTLAEPGQPLPTSRSTACADAMLYVYDREKTHGGEPAFEGDSPTIRESFAWGAQLQAGHTPEEIHAIARRAYAQNSAAFEGTTQTVGTTSTLIGWVHIYEAMRDLVGSLQANGFDVWVVSASAQPIVEVVAGEVGIDASHVVGIRTLKRPDGKLDYRIEGCGTEPDGADTVITFNQGKRCWINRAIFHRLPGEQLARATDLRERAAFAAGDSDTDLAMVQDATFLTLAINRNRPQIMCNAYNDAHHRWIIQPMFIEPMPKHEGPYHCTSLTDEDGKPMTDRADTVFTLPTSSAQR